MNSEAVATALADDLFVRCQTLSPWTVNYVDLEESLAVGSIAQELLAQGGVLYGFSGLTEAERDQRVYKRGAQEWTVASLSFFSVHYWPDVVATAFVTTHASRVIVEALMQTSELAHEQLKVVEREQVLHLAHWRQWISLLIANPETIGEITTAVNKAVQNAGDVLPLGKDYDLLYQRWVHDLTEDISSLGVTPPSNIQRSERVAGGSGVEHLIKNLRTARNPDGQSEYSVY